MNFRAFCLILLLLLWLPAVSGAQPHGTEPQEAAAEKPKLEADQAGEAEKEPLPPEERQAVTEHTVTVAGRQLSYTATAGTLVLKKEDGKALASIFFTAYTLNGVQDIRERPITFAFNGGPGSSSVWLHLGALGPRRVAFADDLQPEAPPYGLTPNQYTLLPATDLVFIDPVSTGFSRAAPGRKPKEFHNVQKDIESVADFIRLYITRFQRWPSPKFLMGESYGTTRVAGLTGYLQERYGIYLNGIMLVSVVLDFQTLSFDPGNDLAYQLFLPTYTATAWFHQQLPPDLQQNLPQALSQAEQFAMGPYSRALAAGASLAEEEQRLISKQLATLTGLSPDYIRRNDLRVPIFRFAKELLRNQGLTVGRFDSRVTGISPDAAAEVFRYDPSYTAIKGAFTAAFNHYVRTELQFQEEMTYEVLTPERVQPWGYNDYENRYLNVAPTLRQAMVEKPFLKVFVANGYFDLATPYFATRYTVDHLLLDPRLRDNIVSAYYEAGHMMYLHEPSLAKFQSDLVAFIRDALTGNRRGDRR